MTCPKTLTILGGGPAGLATAYFARKGGWQPLVLEAAGAAGGNCRTLHEGDYRFDTGAHRFHDQDPEITADVKALVRDLESVTAPSAIFIGGRFLTFPPSPRDLLRFLGAPRFAVAAAAAVTARVRAVGHAKNLAAYANRAYGPPLARLFLLNYSEKLWGVPARELSPRVSGGRLRGLRIRTLFDRNGRSGSHHEGAFFYPKRGYGAITDALAASCGRDAIRCGARVTRVIHAGDRIEAIEINGNERLEVAEVVSTLPLGPLVGLFDPPLSQQMREAAAQIRFRHLLLGVFLIDRPSVTQYASVYFPDPSVPFTRVVEPRNRSADMSPPGKTSLVVEIPIATDDTRWKGADAPILESARSHLRGVGFIDEASELGAFVVRVPHAYPVLDLRGERAADTLGRSLARFRNLHLLGRNGQFQYAWLHTLMRSAKNLVQGSMSV